MFSTVNVWLEVCSVPLEKVEIVYGRIFSASRMRCSAFTANSEERLFKTATRGWGDVAWLMGQSILRTRLMANETSIPSEAGDGSRDRRRRRGLLVVASLAGEIM